MQKNGNRLRWVVAVLAMLCFVGNAAYAADPPAKTYQIGPQSVSKALKVFATQSDLQVIYTEADVGGAKTTGMSGTHVPREALAELLKGTDLKFEFTANNVVVVRKASAGASPSADHDLTNDSTSKPSTDKEVGKNASQDFRLAQVDQTSAGARVSQTPGEAKQTAALEEIVVTAQKREERLQDVPMSLTALTGENLVNNQQFRLEDFVGSVPGLTLIDNGAIGSQLVIRGLTSGFQSINSSVATYIDETPYTAEGPFAGSFLVAPNLDTYDVQRIEVLRGPQGTLYGANAMGGLLKYVTNAPDPRGFSASAESGVSSVSNGATGFDVHGMVNIPIGSAAAVRLVAYDNDYPGFIDDPSRNATDINGSRFSGGRGSILIEPTSDLSIKISAFYQRRRWNDWSNEDVNPGTLQPIFGPLTQERLIDQPGHATAQLYTATISWNMGFASLLSTTSYAKYDLQYLQDYSLAYGDLVSSILQAPYGVAIDQTLGLQTVTQEFRLSSKTADQFDWQVGGYFTNASAEYGTALLPIDESARTVLYNFPTNISDYNMTPHYREFAGFVNWDQHMTSTIDLSLGGRYSHNSQTFYESSSGIFGSSPVSTSSSEGVFTYSVGGRWKFSPDSMLYARIAEGFVPGGPNDVIPFVSQLPGSYSSSTATNYELGIKSSLLERRLSVELSLFHIDWRKIQVLAQINGFGSVTNGGTAQSDGVEWNGTYIPLPGLSLNLNGAYTDARLTEPTPASVGGLTGDRLPSVPLWEASASAKYEHALVGAFSSFVGLDWRFTGARYAEFEPASPRQQMPSYQILDTQLGIRYGDWTAAFYVKNVTNKIAINYVQDATLAGGLGTQSATVYQPRTIGMTLIAKF